MISNLRVRAGIAADRAVRLIVFGAIGLLFALAGLGMLTAALWISLASPYGHAGAALCVGAIYVAVALICFLVGTHRRRIVVPPPAATVPPMAGASPSVRLVEAFLLGLDAARAMRRR